MFVFEIFLNSLCFYLDIFYVYDNSFIFIFVIIYLNLYLIIIFWRKNIILNVFEYIF